MNLHTVPFKSKLTVRCKCRFSMQFAILNSCANRESRTSYRESSCRFLQQPIIESTCREQITRNNTLSIDYKQRPFRIDDSCRNQDSRIETQQSRIESRFSIRFSILTRIENWVSTYFWLVLYNKEPGDWETVFILIEVHWSPFSLYFTENGVKTTNYYTEVFAIKKVIISASIFTFAQLNNTSWSPSFRRHTDNIQLNFQDDRITVLVSQQ